MIARERVAPLIGAEISLRGELSAEYEAVALAPCVRECHRLSMRVAVSTCGMSKGGFGRILNLGRLSEPARTWPKISLSPAVQGQVSAPPAQIAITHPAPTRKPMRRQFYLRWRRSVGSPCLELTYSASGISVSLTASTPDAIEEGGCEADDVPHTHTGASLSVVRTCPNLTAA